MGFEPMSANTSELESDPLDRSGILSCACACAFSCACPCIPTARLELATSGLEVLRAIQLRHAGI